MQQLAFDFEETPTLTDISAMIETYREWRYDIIPNAVKEKPGLPNMAHQLDIAKTERSRVPKKTKLWVILNAEIDYIKEVMGIEHIKT